VVYDHNAPSPTIIDEVFKRLSLSTLSKRDLEGQSRLKVFAFIRRGLRVNAKTSKFNECLVLCNSSTIYFRGDG
jgi:hypothetical protein